MPFPLSRPRRNRQTDWVRRMVRETMPTTDDLVWAMIVHDGDDAREPVSSMPGVERLNVREAAKAAKRAQKLGIPAIAIFPHINPAKKDEQGSEALNPSGLIPQCIKAMKDAAPDVGVICDVALDPFTTHGHDGLIDEAGYVLNDATTKVLVRQALMQAEAGADVLAPSDMMDGRVGAIRDTLEVADMHNVLIWLQAWPRGQSRTLAASLNSPCVALCLFHLCRNLGKCNVCSPCVATCVSCLEF